MVAQHASRQLTPHESKSTPAELVFRSQTQDAQECDGDKQKNGVHAKLNEQKRMAIRDAIAIGKQQTRCGDVPRILH